MTEAITKTAADYVLPPSVVTKRDVSRLEAEVERIDNDVTSQAVRAKTGAQSPQTIPQLSPQLSDFMQLNDLKPASSQAHSALIVQLRQLKNIVPVVHMTFSTETDPESMQQLTAWLRQSVHPQAVIEVGLQPSLIAGVHLRTTNKVHDLSMRSALKGGHQILVNELEALRAGR